MKMKLLLVGLVAASLGVSAAVAAPPPGKGKPPTTGESCKPKVTVVLKGTLAATPGVSASALSVNVTRANRWGRAYVAASQPTSVGVDAKTKVRRQGMKTLGDLRSGDRVLVQARTCKAELAEGATPPPGSDSRKGRRTPGGVVSGEHSFLSRGEGTGKGWRLRAAASAAALPAQTQRPVDL